MRAAARAPAPQRFAVVSDIHGNLPALGACRAEAVSQPTIPKSDRLLAAVIAEMAAAGLEDVVNLGDIVSGPLWPAETGSPHARWALVERADGGTWRVQLRATPYDFEAAARQAERNGRGDWADAVRTGRVGRWERDREQELVKR